MSSIEYNSLLLKISRRLGELNVRDLVFLCRGKIAPGNEHDIHDIRSLFKELEDQNNLGVDRVEHLKEILKAVNEWTLFKEVKKFEIKRKEYNDLLQQISRVLDESNVLERLISICRGKTSEESEGNIHDVRTLFKELENQDNLGIGRLDILKEILNTIENEDLLKEVEKFERRRDEEDEVEIRKAQTAAIVASARSVGGTIIGVLNMKTVCKVAAAGITLVTVRDILTRWSTYDQLVHCFNSCVLPAGTQLIEIGQGCVCFTVRADSLTALMTLWNMYQGGTLRERLHTLLVTDEMLKVAGGEENVKVTVTIEEDEYEKACFEFIHEAEDLQKRRTRRASRRNSDSALSVTLKEDEMTLIKLKQLENRFNLQQERIEILENEMEKLPQLFLETENSETEVSKDQDGGGGEWTYLDPFKKAYVQEFVDNLQDTRSIITGTSDSGVGSSVALSEIGLDEKSEKVPPSPTDEGAVLVPVLRPRRFPVQVGGGVAVIGDHSALEIKHEPDLRLLQKHIARQAQANGGPRPPKRPDYGTVGRPIKLRANFFHLNISPQLTDLYHYDVEITPNKCPKTVKRDVVKEIIKKYRSTTFQGHSPAFDGEKNLYSRIKVPPAELSVTLPDMDGGKDREFKVKIQFAASVSLGELRNFLMGKQNGRNAQDAVQGLDIVMRQIPSCRFTPVGRSFFPFDSRGTPLGEGCEVQFGFYQSIRHSEWKTMLVNIDVSAKGFYKSQDVIDLMCQILELSPRQLEDHKIQIDRGRLEETIRGVRVQTNHVASMKRKYTVWGLSRASADKLEFDVEDETSGRCTKTTVAQYFKERYNLPLRYPHLPCLLVGQKKDRYLPLEICTVIPCERRYLTEQQIANMIRSAARPAPERQQDIQYWAEEMMRSSAKYLKEEFQTSVNPEMVKVDGRVLPAPKIRLGPQDQALVPRDGSWDMRNKALHQGAWIDTWALACFAPSKRCREDQLRHFCNQLAIVSTGEGMKMAAEPVVVRYARGTRDVERLFSSWYVEHPGLQLIMAVLPGKEKYLYAEIKRIGDNVIGIPTQCIQLKLVQQAKAQVCTNISLKINSKLGGVNHVIDPSVKSPVFSKPTIVFGADVTHPSPTENGIPSIAAVVASMDANASKYQARVRAQRHDKGRGAQEIINDLAAIVKELLIEFYKANGKLKPSQIIFYRDGVSEGQFDQVLVHEVRAVQEACMKLEKDYRPRITFVVVQKRHHTRLFCENSGDASGKGKNVPPGTTVDSGITHPYEFDFYLCSHYGIQGTSRPTHYHVLYDDNGFTADSLQQLTYQLCHLYARCARSVSMPAPAYYAHLAAFHARVHVTNGGHGRGDGAVDLEKCSKAIQVNEKMKGLMYFT